MSDIPKSYSILVDLLKTKQEAREAFFLALTARYPHQMQDALSILLWVSPFNLLHIDDMAAHFFWDKYNIVKIRTTLPNKGYILPTG